MNIIESKNIPAKGSVAANKFITINVNKQQL